MKSTIKILTSLLEGKVINCQTMIKDFGYSNASREVIRKIEIPFGITLKRSRVNKKNRYGELVSFLNYSLHAKDNPKVSKLIKSLNKSLS